MFDKAGISFDDDGNLVRLADHVGPHPEEYHSYVYNYLQARTADLEGEEYASAHRAGLQELRKEILTPGSNLNGMLTKP
jgi:filamentous hemagglutinin